MASNNQRIPPVTDSSDEDDDLLDDHIPLRTIIPAPVFGRPTANDLLDDDEEEEKGTVGSGAGNDDPSEGAFEDESLVYGKANNRRGREPLQSERSDPLPAASAGRCVTALATMSAPVSEHAIPTPIALPTGIPVSLVDSSRSSVKLRAALKTVHSGRSLNSMDSEKSKTKEPSPPAQSPSKTPMSAGMRPRFQLQEDQQNFPATSRAALFASRLARRSRFGLVSQRKMSSRGLNESDRNREPTPSTSVRRYKPDDYCLVCNHQSRWANLVNRHGFPPGEGESEEEQRGPYIYVVAKVKEVHFEEFAAYYTVERCDTGAEQRADADFMEPLRTGRGEVAALRAATQASTEDVGENGSINGSFRADIKQDVSYRKKFAVGMQNCCFLICLPILWLLDCLWYVGVAFLMPCWKATLRYLQGGARLFLNGHEPFLCRMRWTMVNFVVMCSTWYMFIDQARLALFPTEADAAVAVINLIVWLVLVLELTFEVFIRPDGFQNLIISDRAYAPTTVLFINSFHLIVESVSLLIFIPEWYCLISTYECDDRLKFSFYNAILMSAIGPTRLESLYGRAFLALIRLRVFGSVRHWKNMWITNTFINMKWRTTPTGVMSILIPQQRSSRFTERKSLLEKENSGHDNDSPKKDTNLANASTIGTALMVTNSYRAMAILWVITGFFPILAIISSGSINAQAPGMTRQLQATNLLANSEANPSCQFLADSVLAWMLGFTSPGFSRDSDSQYLLNLDILPPRCPYLPLGDQPVSIAACTFLSSQPGLDEFTQSVLVRFCESWNIISTEKTVLADELGLRTGSILLYRLVDVANFTLVSANGTVTGIEVANYTVVSSFDESYTIRSASMSSLCLQLSLLVGVLGGLSVLRRDAEVLVLKPLRHMLKIVARYAKNPLVPPKLKRRSASMRRKASSRRVSEDTSSDSDESSVASNPDEMYDDELALGSYETEQLITAVTKITDLLRKCWGVAGAGIISTNLATREGALTEVFNPTVPGKSVYALFGFAAIGGFDHALRSLGGDVMILINDVAAVLHGEVFRWGFSDSGQCNKNLGSAFLMVFRIGLVKEVVEKLEQATDVIFSNSSGKSSNSSAAKRRIKQSALASTAAAASAAGSSSTTPSMTTLTSTTTVAAKVKRKIKRVASVKAMSLSLQTLPGISTFTDRAVIGMLKSFAGIYRDNKIRNWNNDFRLGAGVSAFTVSMLYGMDAGWAVEGAVGSEYKIDATYLSPHVNMASRMMSACKMYGVNILLSQAVQELTSDVARSKLRHLDTVTVKGSSVRQRIYTYDARPKGVDFFLYCRSDEQADFDADRYSPNTWNTDQDLKAMRQHVTEEFLHEFTAGRKLFLSGDWKEAIKRLERANELMIENALEEGYLEDEFEQLAARAGDDAKAAAEELKLQNGDGPSLYLINFMKSKGGVAPDRWEGWHPLTNK